MAREGAVLHCRILQHLFRRNLGFGLVTTLPNPTQAEIHNRMIITLDEKMGKEFLNQRYIEEFQYPEYSPNLEYVYFEPEKFQIPYSKDD